MNPSLKLNPTEVTENVGFLLQFSGPVAKQVTAQINLVTERSASYGGAERQARRIAKGYVRLGMYLHALVADSIANTYQRLKENQ